MDRRTDYAFDLPAAQIAQTPADRRDGSRLLVLGPDGAISDRGFPDLVDAIPADAVVVVNDARVIPARVHAHKDTGGKVELLFVEPAAQPGAWMCMARARRPLRAGQVLRTRAGDVTLLTDRATDGTVTVRVEGDVLAFLDACGELPLPPYIESARRRLGDAAPTVDDRTRYQTVYAASAGAVAAPTAGLHFTPALLSAIAAAGHDVATLTLDVGPGTFRPVKTEEPADHVMDEERYEIPPATAEAVTIARVRRRPEIGRASCRERV